MILIVDDKKENLFSLKSILELHHFKVDTADSGEMALKKVLKNRYSLIILDVQMPGMDGFEVAEAISGYSQVSDIPIIFLSAVNTEKKFIAKGYTSGGIDYITKPVDADILLLKVTTFYRLSEQQRELNKARESLLKEIDERKKLQEESDRRMQELRSVLESLPQIAFTINPDGIIEYANQEWYHYSRQTTSYPEIHEEDRKIWNAWEAAFEQGKEFISEIRIRNLDTKAFRHFLLKIIPVRQGKNIVRWIGTFTDIHQQKSANEVLEIKVKERTQELLNSNELLEARNHELEQFTWAASHDLKEPLRKIQTYISIVSEKVEDDFTGKYLQKINQSSKRMNDLITDILNYSRLSVSSLFQPVAINEIIEETLEDLEHMIREKKAKVEVGPIPEIEAVAGQIRQIFHNLLTNSLKFSKAGVPPEIEITATIVDEKTFESPASPGGEYCKIEVKDNGIGFNEQYTDLIFLLFQRLHNRADYEGTGIGLSITKKIIDKHNGLITARSKENEGCCFIIILPLKQQEASTNMSKKQLI